LSWEWVKRPTVRSSFKVNSSPACFFRARHIIARREKIRVQDFPDNPMAVNLALRQKAFTSAITDRRNLARLELLPSWRRCRVSLGRAIKKKTPALGAGVLRKRMTPWKQQAKRGGCTLPLPGNAIARKNATSFGERRLFKTVGIRRGFIGMGSCARLPLPPMRKGKRSE